MKTKSLALSIILLGAPALAGEPDGTGAKSKVDGGAGVQEADNTGINKRDNHAAEPTAGQQGNANSDVDLTAKIRRSIVSDKSLSTNAHNVKIIAQNGSVTLKGPVQSEAAKHTIEQRASSIAGQSNVKSEIDVQH